MILPTPCPCARCLEARCQRAPHLLTRPSAIQIKSPCPVRTRMWFKELGLACPFAQCREAHCRRAPALLTRPGRTLTRTWPGSQFLAVTHTSLIRMATCTCAPCRETRCRRVPLSLTRAFPTRSESPCLAGTRTLPKSTRHLYPCARCRETRCRRAPCSLTRVSTVLFLGASPWPVGSCT